ncbi:MAG: DUF1835 domain-containing protein [Flavobacteriaceae bacterium]|nr:DUF1835 domain-containing protein [Flavobacteriaceae bacterium]
MMQEQLHITNGTSLTNYLEELDIKGEKLTWHEMLCEGSTSENIDSETFLETRNQFLNTFYNVDLDAYEFKDAFKPLDHAKNYTSITLWFEYDLFCHINLIAAISLIRQKKIDLPIFLVCSGRIKGQTGLKGLSELDADQLFTHYQNRIELNSKDLELAEMLWKIYCGKDHNLFKKYITKPSSFKYLGNCLKAHLKRFPDSQSGLGTLERNILEIIFKNRVNSKHHLLGYILNYQGYYGYGDLQIERMIDSLDLFFTKENNQLKLNRKGHEALLGHHNFSTEINNNLDYGGVNRLQFQFNQKENKLIKTISNAH